MINFSLITGQSNISTIFQPLRNLLVQEFGFSNQELFRSQRNGQPIERWIVSANPCVLGPHLIDDLNLIDARIATLGIANIVFDTLFIVQGEANTNLTDGANNNGNPGEFGKVGWEDKAGCWIDTIQNHLQTTYGQQFGQVVIMTTPVQTLLPSFDVPDILRSEVACDLLQCQKDFALSRPNVTFVESSDFIRGDTVHLNATQGSQMATRLWDSARSGNNYPAGICGSKT